MKPFPGTPHLTWFLIVVLLATAISMSACSPQQPTLEPTTITFAHQQYETEYYEPLVEEFMRENPEITVELTVAYGYDPETYSEADAMAVNLFLFSYLQPQEPFLDLTPLIEQDIDFDFSDFYPGTVELFTRDDKVWAIPSGIDTFVLYYNKDLFNTNGIFYPTNDWTWDDLLSAASRIREEPDTFGYGVPEDYSILYAMILMSQHGGVLFDELDGATMATYNHPLNVEAMQWYQDLYHKYNVAPTTEQASTSFGYGDEAIIRGVLTGHIGMWPGNFSDRNGATWVVQWDKLSWGMVALPGDVNAATSGFGSGYVIGAETQNPLAAWRWLTYLSEQIPQRLVPARRSLAESEDFQKRVGPEAASAALKSIQNVTLISPDLFQLGDSLDYFSDAVYDIVEGAVAVKDALDRAQERVEEP